MPPPPPHHHHDRTAASAIALALDADRLAKAIAPWAADPNDRAFLVRCIIGEGPIHHRGSSYALIALAGAIAERLGVTAPPSDAHGVTVPMRLPPHLEKPDEEPPVYPLRLDIAGIDRIAGGKDGVRQVLTDAVTDGPPHHALANVALLNLLAAILRRVEAQP